METKGSLFIVSAPSGAGKSSLIDTTIKTMDNIKVSISHTTREPRPGEIDGKHYHFITKPQFEELIDKNAFLEWANVFGNYYGTSRPMLEENLSKGFDIFLDIDWQGARQIRKQMPKSKSIFILPPSKAELENRLKKRKQDSLEVIERRMKNAVSEISHFNEYDYLIINDNFNDALADLKAIILSAHLTLVKQELFNKTLLDDLLS